MARDPKALLALLEEARKSLAAAQLKNAAALNDANAAQAAMEKSKASSDAALAAHQESQLIGNALIQGVEDFFSAPDDPPEPEPEPVPAPEPIAPAAPPAAPPRPAAAIAAGIGRMPGRGR